MVVSVNNQPYVLVPGKTVLIAEGDVEAIQEQLGASYPGCSLQVADKPKRKRSKKKVEPVIEEDIIDDDTDSAE